MSLVHETPGCEAFPVRATKNLIVTNLTSTAPLKKLGLIEDTNSMTENKIAEQVMKAVRDTRELDAYAQSLRLDDSKMLEELDELERQWNQSEAEAPARTKVQAKANEKKSKTILKPKASAKKKSSAAPV